MEAQTTMELDLGEVPSRIESVIKGIGIPPCPEILVELMAEMGKENPDLRHVGLLIGTDAGLAAAMLKTVNSAYYGLATKATTVRSALALVGLKGAGHLLTGYYLRQAFATVSSPVVVAFWKESSRVGLVSAFLSRVLGIGDRDEAHTFGLFRDCGIPVLRGHLPDYDAVVAAANASDRRFTDVEQEACGVDHACVGSALAESWSLPAHMVQAIVWHHVHDVLGYADAPILDRSKDLIALALLAERVVAALRGEASCPEWDRGGAQALAHLHLTDAQVDPLMGEIAQLEL